jgi:hypothetical protein
VADVQLTDTTANAVVGTQQMVLFFGATPFVYAGFAGPITTGDTYEVQISAEPGQPQGLSWPSSGDVPTIDVADAQLLVVPSQNPEALAYAYAPVLYGRSTSALHDVPLLADATATPEPGGATKLSYTVVWSHEDAGTGFLPFLEDGEWGRLTDIEDAISFTVAADGSVSGAQYLWGGEPATGFADSEGALQEVDEPFQGTWDGHHPIVRDATGNNDFSDHGTTPFRFQLAPVPGPGPGQAREAVMDANPFTYQVMGEEVDRWYGDGSPDPNSPQPGDARQYAYVDLSTSGSSVSSVAVALQLAGSGTWYSSDFGTGFPLSGTGHVRTVVKLPTDWLAQGVTGVRVQVLPASAAPSVTVNGLQVEGLTAGWELEPVTLPQAVVAAESPATSPALDLRQVTGPAGQVSVRPGAPAVPWEEEVTDSVGDPLAGVPVTFTASTAGLLFDSCGCTRLTVPTGPAGTASSGPAQASLRSGTVRVTIGVPDSASPELGTDLAVTGTPVEPRPGYGVVESNGGVQGFGPGRPPGRAGAAPLASPVVGAALTPDGGGEWLVASNGDIATAGNATFEGSLGGRPRAVPVAGLSARPDGLGYWLVGADGGVFAFGDAPYLGSMAGRVLNAPIVGTQATPDGRGYWLVGADGGVFAFGDAPYLGSMAGRALNAPIVAMASTGDGAGYRLAGRDGGVFCFGQAPYLGAAGGVRPEAAVGLLGR